MANRSAEITKAEGMSATVKSTLLKSTIAGLTFRGFNAGDGGPVVTKEAAMDGYDMGGRILDGVEFKVSVREDGSIEVVIADRAREHFETLNPMRWRKEVGEYIAAVAAEGGCFYSDEFEDLMLMREQE